MLSLFLLCSPAWAASQEVPAPRLDPLPDRLLFLAVLWTIIAALLIILHWMISHADLLHRMLSGPSRKESNPPSLLDPSLPSLPSEFRSSAEEKKAPPPP